MIKFNERIRSAFMDRFNVQTKKRSVDFATALAESLLIKDVAQSWTWCCAVDNNKNVDWRSGEIG